MAKGKPNKSVDFFISYATPDEATAREIGAILDEAGYSYIAQFRDFRPGTNFVREMQRGLEASSRLIALLSPAYEKSNNCQAEWSAAYAEDPGSDHGKIVPFLIAEGELNPLARQIVYKSLVGLNSDQQRAAVLEAIRPWAKGKAAKGAADGRPGTPGREAGPPKLGRKPGNLPASIGYLFKGREAFLQQLRESFRHKAAAAITGKAVHGLGGVGKTRAAIEYGHAYAGDYVATFFLVGKSESDLKDSLAALAGTAVLDLPEKDVPDLDARLAAVVRWLRANPGWLLIIDNVDDEPAAKAARAFLDQVGGGGGHVLITSRVGDWGHMVEPLELDLLAVEAAKDLLRESTPRRTKSPDEDAALTRLAEEQLGCLSLALVQAAAYIEERRIGFADYHALFEKEAKKLLAKLGDSAVRNLGYPLPVALTWQASIAQLSDAAKLLLDMLSWLSIEPVPRSLFDVWPESETIDLDESLAELTRYNFVHWESGNGAFTVHRLVAQVTRDNMHEIARDRALSALFPWFFAINPQIYAGDVRCWPFLLPMLPHALQLFERTNLLGPYLHQTDLYDEYASLLQSLARYSEAEPIFRRTLEIEEMSYGNEHPEVARRLNNLSGLLLTTGRFDEAEPYIRRALAVAEAAYGPNHSVVATRLSNLGSLLRDTKRPEEAEKLFRRALKIDEDNLGPEHFRVAVHLSNLAGLLFRTDRQDLAEPLYRRALEIDEINYGPEHPAVAIDLNNLAALLQSDDQAAEAAPLARRATMIFLQASRQSGHLLPDTLPAIQTYCTALFRSGHQIDKAMDMVASVVTEMGFDPTLLLRRVFSVSDEVA